MILPVKRRVVEREEVLIERKLAAPGKVVVRVGDKVSAEENIGTAEVSSGLREIDLAAMFGVHPREVERRLLKEVGQVVHRGEPLFRLKRLLGLRSEEYNSPVEGEMSEVRDGVVSIRSTPTEVSLRAGFAGTVDRVYEGEGVAILATATTFCGVKGVGKLHFGEIKVVGRGGDILLPQDLDSDCREKIVVGGAQLATDTIEKALAIGVVGLVTSGINFREAVSFSSREKAGLGLLILEGYGLHQFDNEILGLLQNLDGRYSALNGEDAMLLVSTDGHGRKQSGQPWKELKAGDTVRGVIGPELGRVGKVTKVEENESVVASGLKSRLVKIETKEGDISIPWQNLEILEN
jgi:preprotein translocase subunit YajC